MLQENGVFFSQVCCLLLLTPVAANPASETPQPAALNRTESRETCRQIVERLKSGFLDPGRVTDALKSDWHSGLMLDLDPTRHYFLQEDQDHFVDLETHIPRGTIDFEFAKAVQARWIQRIHDAERLAEYWLVQPHDFTTDEVVLKRYETFARSQDDLNDRWRKRIKRELLGDKLSGLLDEHTPDSLRNRYRMIFEKQRTIDDDELLSNFINLLLKRTDPHAKYYTADEMMDFEVGHVRPYRLGLYTEIIDGERQINEVSPFFTEVVGPDLAAKVTGMRLVSLKANNTQLVFLGYDRASWGSVDGRDPAHRELGKAESVTLELRDPYSRRRVDVQWPRLRGKY